MTQFETFAAPFTKNDYPDEIVQYHFGPYAAVTPADLAGSGAVDITAKSIPMFVTDREIAIESITVRASVVGSAHHVQFWKIPSGLLDAAVASSNGSGEIGEALHSIADGVCDADDLTAYTTKSLTLDSSADKIGAGWTIVIRGETGLTLLDNLYVTVRVRNRDYRTNDAGEKVWITPQPD